MIIYWNSLDTFGQLSQLYCDSSLDQIRNNIILQLKLRFFSTFCHFQLLQTVMRTKKKFQPELEEKFRNFCN